MKTFHLSILLLSLASSSLSAQNDKIESTNNHDHHLEKIFSLSEHDQFKKSLEEASNAGVHKQLLLEAEFIHLIDQENNLALAKLFTSLSDYSDQFDPNISQIFALKEDWLAIINYTQALASLQDGDHAAFKKHITEAFWLSPGQAPIFESHINQLKLNEAMKSVTIDPKTELTFQGGKTSTTLEELTKGKDATVLHFWSPLSQEFQLSIPDFIKSSNLSKAKNIAVISILTDKSPDALRNAETMKNKELVKAHSSWVIHTKGNLLIQQLRIASIPTIVLISKKGKILFNGHPHDDHFLEAIKNISP